MKKQKTILFVIHKLSYGGAEKILTFVANGLNKRGYSVYVYTFEGISKHYVLDEGVIHIAENKICTKRVIRRFIQIGQISRAINKVKPDIVVSFLNNPNLLCILATLFSTTPLIISERGDPYQANGLFGKSRKLMYGLSDGVVFQTEGARNYFCKALRSKSHIIPNPVTTKSIYKPVSVRSNEIAFVGRFELRQKRQDLMLLAFRKVVDIYPEIKLVFYGDGPDEQKVQDITRQLNLSENVCFAGLVNNVYEKISNARMLVLTSDYEGIPNALIEAMSVGLPVIACDCSPGGARMLIEHKNNGLLVPKGDVAAIAKAIIFLIENEQVAKAYGRKASEIRDRFEPEKILDAWESCIYKSVGTKNAR